MQQELEQFLLQNPELRFIDLLLHDLNGVDRGKRIDAAAAASVYERGLLLPGSLFALDVQGGTVQATGLGFDEGDADRPCLPVPGSLVRVPWLDHGVAQAQVTMHEPDGRPFFADPRHLLTQVLNRFSTLGLTPVIAIELEFYLLDRERDALGLPQPPRGPLTGRREFRTQINSMTDLDEYSARAGRHRYGLPRTAGAGDVRAGGVRAGAVRGQPCTTAPMRWRACDEAVRFKRIVKSVARRHEMDATFLAKPYRDMAGSGLHVHVSLLDAAGRNVFADECPHGSEALLHAIAGTLSTMAEGMAVFAPNANSWRRFRPEPTYRSPRPGPSTTAAPLYAYRPATPPTGAWSTAWPAPTRTSTW